MARTITPVKVHRIAKMPESYNKKTTIEDRIIDVEKKIAELNSRLTRLKECKEFYDSLPFKDGDVAFHKDHGNVIVRKIEFGSPESDFEDIKYVIVSKTSNSAQVSFRELVPITEATKVLYGKSDKKET